MFDTDELSRRLRDLPPLDVAPRRAMDILARAQASFLEVPPPSPSQLLWSRFVAPTVVWATVASYLVWAVVAATTVYR